MMGKREEWTKLLFCFLLLASSYGVEKGHGLDARGCRILTNLCLRDKDCDRQVLYQRCRQHYVGHKARRTEDPVPPMSLVENWMFFPGNALGPEEKRKHGMRHVKSYPNYHKASEYSSEDGENSQYHQQRQAVRRETEKEASENEAGHERSDYDDDDDEYSDEDQRSLQTSRSFETRPARGEAESRNPQNNYDAGDHHHADPSYKIRLVRLAELNDDLDRVDKILADKGAADMKILSRIKKKDRKSLYALSQTNRENNLLLDEKQVADTKRQASENLDEKKLGDYLNFYASSSLQDAGLANSEKRRSSEEQEARPEVKIPVEPAKADVNNKAKPQEKSRRAFDGDAGDVKASHFYPLQNRENTVLSKDQKTETSKDRGTLILRTSKSVDPKTLKTLGGKLQQIIWGIDPSNQKIFNKISIDPANDKIIDLRMQVSSNAFSSQFNPKLVANRINQDEDLKKNISIAVGLIVLGAQSRRAGDRRNSPYSLPKDKNWDEFAIIIAIVGGCTLGLIVASVIICSLKRRSHRKKPISLHKKEAISDYEELCRTQMAVNSATSPRTMKAIKADRQRHGLIDGQGKITKKSWREEPLAYNMDITTGHVILSYMEDHLNDENKLSSEWEALCNYKADQNETAVGEDSKNASKNRYSNVLPYDHTRVKLRETANVFHSDYINASYITDADPRNPAYIATQGPLDNTVADFWQMIWEQGVVVIVNLTRLSDMGLPQCHRYWPEEGSDVYNTYQVHLISEHIWCDDYIVRSFYLKHLLTSETRTVTQFHFLTWPDLSVPESAKPILEFRRKVNKCYRGQACPIVVHCNNGVGRTGTYVLIDMVLKKMIKGTKEIDIAATLEHLRDQRPDMVKTKAQFEFTLAAVAEEVTAILSSLSS